MNERESLECTFQSLRNFDIDPMSTVVGFFSVVGQKSHATAAKIKEVRQHEQMRNFNSSMEYKDIQTGSFNTDNKGSQKQKMILRLSQLSDNKPSSNQKKAPTIIPEHHMTVLTPNIKSSESKLHSTLFATLTNGTQSSVKRSMQPNSTKLENADKIVKRQSTEIEPSSGRDRYDLTVESCEANPVANHEIPSEHGTSIKTIQTQLHLASTTGRIGPSFGPKFGAGKTFVSA